MTAAYGRRAGDSDLIDPGPPRAEPPQRLAFSQFGMVSSAHHRATQIGARVLESGGNAVDAAVATAFALGVCEPQASGLGGQTAMLIHVAEPRRTFALDGSSRAPNRVVPGSLKKSQRRHGYVATTVPATPACLGYALRTYGTMPLADILEPSIALAADGFAWSTLQRDLSARERKQLKSGNAHTLFLRDGSRPFRAGDTVRQPYLARTLRRLADHGVEDFYAGKIAAEIVADMEANGGLIHMDDLARIPWPVERKRISTKFQNLRVVTFPPPGAGGVLVEMLRLLEEFPVKLWDPHDVRGALLLVEVMQRAALHRQDRPFDPTYYGQTEDRRVDSADYPQRIARRIRKQLKTRGETTHLSVMDRSGNVVSLTQSIEGVFGSGVLTPSLGFLYNNYMLAFEDTEISHPYYLRPNAVPWASVAPTIVFKGSRPWVALGSPGSDRIVTAIFQVLVRVVTGSDPFEAVAAPRLHCSTESKVSIESPRFRDDVPAELERLGHIIDHRDDFSFYLGCVQMAIRERDGFIGVADPRRDGSAKGPGR